MLMDLNGKEMMSENRVKQGFQNRLTTKPQQDLKDASRDSAISDGTNSVLIDVL